MAQDSRPSGVMLADDSQFVVSIISMRMIHRQDHGRAAG
jgi:hypothetical protein